MTWVGQVTAWVALLAAVGGAATAIIRTVRPIIQRMHDVADDVLGDPPRPADGWAGRPGFGARLTTLESVVGDVREQVHPNHGGSLRDAVDGIRLDVALLATRQDQSERVLTQHITHGGHG